MVQKEAQKKSKQKTAKVSLETQFEQSNLKDFTEDELVRMVNATSGDKDFKTAYPKATFTRTLAYKYLEAKYDYNFVGRSYVLPHGVIIDDLLEIYRNHIDNTSDAKVMQSSNQNIDVVAVDIDAKKKRQTFSMNEDTYHKWESFTKDSSKKSTYLTAACELLMQKVADNTVDIKPYMGSLVNNKNS